VLSENPKLETTTESESVSLRLGFRVLILKVFTLTPAFSINRGRPMQGICGRKIRVGIFFLEIKNKPRFVHVNRGF